MSARADSRSVLNSSAADSSCTDQRRERLGDAVVDLSGQASPALAAWTPPGTPRCSSVCSISTAKWSAISCATVSWRSSYWAARWLPKLSVPIHAPFRRQGHVHRGTEFALLSETLLQRMDVLPPPPPPRCRRSTGRPVRIGSAHGVSSIGIRARSTSTSGASTRHPRTPPGNPHRAGAGRMTSRSNAISRRICSLSPSNTSAVSRLDAPIRISSLSTATCSPVIDVRRAPRPALPTAFLRPRDWAPTAAPPQGRIVQPPHAPPAACVASLRVGTVSVGSTGDPAGFLVATVRLTYPKVRTCTHPVSLPEVHPNGCRARRSLAACWTQQS